MLNFDHFFFCVEQTEFDALIKFFSQFPFTQHYETSSNHGSWQGLYPFVREGAFIEFIRHSDRNPAGTMGLAFSNTDKSDLHSQLSESHAEFNWQRFDRRKADNSEYYISSEPENQGDKIFYWILDWQGIHPQKRHSSAWGVDPANPLVRVDELSFSCHKQDFDLMKEHSQWFANEANVNHDKIDLTVPQYSDTETRLVIKKDDSFFYGMEVEIQKDFKVRVEQQPYFQVELQPGRVKIERNIN